MPGLLVNIDVRNLEEALRFYTEGIGLRLVRRLGPDIAELGGAPSPVFLIAHPPGSAPHPDAGASRSYERHWTPVHLDFAVADLERAVSRAVSAGAVCEGPVRGFEAGRYQVGVRPLRQRLLPHRAR